MPSSRHPNARETLDALVRRARRDESAFHALHERLAHGLRRFFLRRTNRLDLAEELAQQTWYESWRAVRAGRYDPDRSAFTTFLYAVGYKVWLQHRRAARVRPDESPVTEPDDLLSDDRTDADLHLAEALDALRACLRHDAGLSDEERHIISELFSEATERGLARSLQVAASTVHSRKSAALQKLRNCLRRKGFSDFLPERDAPPGG